MKRMLLVMGFAAAAALFASQNGRSATGNADDAAARRKRFNARTGGLIQHPGTGKIIVADIQKRVGSDVVRSTADFVTKEFKVAVGHDNLPKFSISFAGTHVKEMGASAMLFVVDDPQLPFSLIAPEAKWGCVNVAAIASDSPTQETLEARYKKMFMRVASALLGAGASAYKVSVMQSVSSLQDLDGINGIGLDPQSLMAIMQRLPKLGITPPKMVPYIKACQEGWAPAPTNDVQKAIWEKVKADKERGPTNPITIPPPKKK